MAYAALPGTRATSGVDPDRKARDCKRCGTTMHDPRKHTVRCQTCRDVLAFEAKCLEQGIDLATLEDDQFVRWRTVNNERVLVIEREKRAVAA